MTPVTPSSVCDSEREAFEASMKAMEGYPFAGAFANLMWKSWQDRAALAERTQQEALTDEQKRSLIGNFFAESWAVEHALNLLHDFERATRPTSAANNTAPMQPSDKEVVNQIMRGACESEEADPEDPETICIDIGDLRGIVEAALAARTQAPIQPASESDPLPDQDALEAAALRSLDSPANKDHGHDAESFCAGYVEAHADLRAAAPTQHRGTGMPADFLAAPTQAPMQPSDDRADAAQALLSAAEEFWYSERSAGAQGAVKWLTGDDGSLVIYTRGEYRDTLMQNIDEIGGKEHAFAAGGEAVRETLIKELTAQASWVPSGPAGVMHRAAAFLTAAPASQAAGGEADDLRKRLQALRAGPANLTVAEEQTIIDCFHALAAAPAAAVEPSEYAKSLIETLDKIALFLDIDLEAAKKAPGKPSDVYIAAIKAHHERAAAAPEGLTGWNLLTPEGNIAATETTCVRAWARINGYKPTVEGLLGYEEQGWRVVPATPDAKTAEVRKPLTPEQIENLRGEANRGFNIDRDDYFKAFRDAESAHGIGDQP